MRLDLTGLSLLSPLALAALAARFALGATYQRSPPPPARPKGYDLPQRVHVALRAAARARR